MQVLSCVLLEFFCNKLFGFLVSVWFGVLFVFLWEVGWGGGGGRATFTNGCGEKEGRPLPVWSELISLMQIYVPLEPVPFGTSKLNK